MSQQSFADRKPRTDLESFFDGAAPDWKDVCHPQLKARPAVQRVVQEFLACDLEDRSVLLRIGGATGDGKSTVLMQAALALVQSSAFEVLYWRSRPDARLTLDAVHAMRTMHQKFLIVSDNAEALLADIDKFAGMRLHEEDIFVHFLLASRDVDWNAERDQLGWKLSIASRWEPSFRVLAPVNLRTVDPADAQVLAENWINCSSSRPSLISDNSIQKIAQDMLTASRASEGRQAFMGGILAMRFDSERLRSRLLSLLSTLSEVHPGPPTTTLADFLVVLAAVDLSDIAGVPPDVAAQFLGITESDLRPRVEVPMKREFFLGTSSRAFFSRHPMISKALLELTLNDESDLRVESTLDKFLRDVRAIGEQSGYRPGFGQMFDLGRRLMSSDFSHELIGQLGLLLCRTACVVSPRHLSAYVALSQTLRKLDLPHLAVTDVWEVQASRLDDPSAWDDFDNHVRGSWSELSTAFGMAGDQATAYWAAQVSISDRPRARLVPNDVSIALNKMAYNAKLAYDEGGEREGVVDLLTEVEALTCSPQSPFLAKNLYPSRYLEELGIEPRIFGGADALVAAIRRAAASIPTSRPIPQWCKDLVNPRDNSLDLLMNQVRRFEHVIRRQ